MTVLLGRAADFPEKIIDKRKKRCYDTDYKSCDEDTLFRKDTQRGASLVRWPCKPAGADTTSELSGGNAGTGAPVKASMSGGLGRNQGGTVE